MKMYQKQKLEQLRGEKKRASTRSVKAGEIGEWKGGWWGRGMGGERAECEIKSGLMKGRVRLSELAGRREVNSEREKRAGERSAWGKNAGWGRKADTQGFVLKAKRERDGAIGRERERLCLGFMHRGGTGERARAQKPCPALSRVVFEG